MPLLILAVLVVMYFGAHDGACAAVADTRAAYEDLRDKTAARRVERLRARGVPESELEDVGGHPPAPLAIKAGAMGAVGTYRSYVAARGAWRGVRHGVRRGWAYARGGGLGEPYTPPPRKKEEKPPTSDIPAEADAKKDDIVDAEVIDDDPAKAASRRAAAAEREFLDVVLGNPGESDQEWADFLNRDRVHFRVTYDLAEAVADDGTPPHIRSFDGRFVAHRVGEATWHPGLARDCRICGAAASADAPPAVSWSNQQLADYLNTIAAATTGPGRLSATGIPPIAIVGDRTLTAVAAGAAQDATAHRNRDLADVWHPGAPRVCLLCADDAPTASPAPAVEASSTTPTRVMEGLHPMPIAEVYTYDQTLVFLDEAVANATRELDNATVILANAKDDLARIEQTAANMRSAGVDAANVAAVNALMEPARNRMDAAQDFVTSCEQDMATAATAKEQLMRDHGAVDEAHKSAPEGGAEKRFYVEAPPTTPVA